jgi:hypothetical protein
LKLTQSGTSNAKLAKRKLNNIIEIFYSRNCDVLVPQIIKFLFHLSKQKEQKLITIPKIINLTDNILANSSIRKCAVLTLCELAYEIFFNQKLNVSENAEMYEREMDTQKEVIISMMMKFLDDDEVRMIIIRRQNKKRKKRKKTGGKKYIFYHKKKIIFVWKNIKEVKKILEKKG